ncbi:hypothetical protein B0681_05860 [Moraxella porci DSM 25326]|uniref:Uncharacterized protein n=1 Tax=Moraxella porci DSM 25326 TaxID=573983 RepID=A0A1T0CRM1_9GAMM|nr:hypothetical protein B0681_05860 [Moraxella porci DSM 25326]
MGENDQVYDLSVCLFSIAKTNKRMIRLFLKNKSFFCQIAKLFCNKADFNNHHTLAIFTYAF